MEINHVKDIDVKVLSLLSCWLALDLLSRFYGALMHNVTSPLPRLRIAIARGVASSQLSTLLALQREAEPEVTLTFSEIAGCDLARGLRDGLYDAGLSLQGSSDLSLQSKPLWIETLAVATPLQCFSFDRAEFTIAELMDYPVFRWKAEICPLLDRRLSFLPPVDQKNIQHVPSFEMMALWVGAGYGIGVTMQSRIEQARGWKIGMRLLADGPYEVVTHLLRPQGEANSAVERFERRAIQVARTNSA